MLRFLLVTISLIFTINLVGQDQTHPVFVTTATLQKTQEEADLYIKYTKDLRLAQANNDRYKVRVAQNKMKHILDKIVYRSQFIDPQLDKHMDSEEMKELKQKWVDGLGFQYYINLERFRNTPSLTEIKLTPKQYEDYKKSTTELKALKASYDDGLTNKSMDHLSASENLLQATDFVSSRNSILTQ